MTERRVRVCACELEDDPPTLSHIRSRTLAVRVAPLLNTGLAHSFGGGITGKRVTIHTFHPMTGVCALVCVCDRRIN